MSILLATRDDEVAGRCRRAVSAEHPLEVADGVAQLEAKIRTLSPSVIILDSEVLGRPLDRAVAPIVAAAGSSRVIVMTPAFSEEEEISLLKIGVKGCCRRGIDSESLQQVLNVAHSGGVWVTRTLVPRLVAELRRYAQAPHSAPAAQQQAPTPSGKVAEDKLKDLTQREREIVKLILGGANNKQVAEALDISDRTVKGHLSSVFQKLGVPDRLKLVHYLNEGQTKPATPARRS